MRTPVTAIHVAQLLQQPQGATRQVTFEEEPRVLGEPSVVAPVRGEATLLRTGRGILANCRFETALAVECGRCLEPTVVPVSGRLQEEFIPSVDVRSGAPIENEPDAETFLIGDDHVLDLSEAIRQHVLMNAPLQPLCRPECRGLCPDCGVDLNERACDCPPVEVGSPFDALRQLMIDGGDQARRA